MEEVSNMYIPINTLLELEEEPLVVLFSYFDQPLEKFLSLLDAEIRDVDFVGDAMGSCEQAFPETVVGRELLKCSPFQSFFVILFARRP